MERDRPRAFGVACHLAQGIPRPVPGCDVVLRCMWVPGGAPLPTAAQGAGGGRVCPPVLAKLPPILSRALECVGERGTGATGVSGEGELEASREHGV